MKNTSQTVKKLPHLMIVGHRGAAGLAAENTVTAINKAIQCRVDEIEIDVRVTKDQVVVVHHNRYVQDETTAHFDIRYHTYNELKRYKPDLATLEEAIQAINKRVPLQIEVKGGEQTLPVIKVLQNYLIKGWHEHDFLIGSKKQSTLMEMHRALPAIPKVVIEPWSGLRATLRARQIDTKRLSMRSTWLWSGFIRPMSRRGYRLYAYTLNDPAKARHWLNYGLTGVITDNPERYQ